MLASAKRRRRRATSSAVAAAASDHQGGGGKEGKKGGRVRTSLSLSLSAVSCRRGKQSKGGRRRRLRRRRHASRTPSSPAVPLEQGRGLLFCCCCCCWCWCRRCVVAASAGTNVCRHSLRRHHHARLLHARTRAHSEGERQSGKSGITSPLPPPLCEKKTQWPAPRKKETQPNSCENVKRRRSTHKARAFFWSKTKGPPPRACQHSHIILSSVPLT